MILKESSIQLKRGDMNRVERKTSCLFGERHLICSVVGCSSGVENEPVLKC